ncbi:MAG: type II toxin-antitoxin system RelE/ParE family toxin [Thermomicrobiales bacterium]
MGWNVEVTNEFEAWYDGLDLAEAQAVASAITTLEQDGPALGRPLVDTLKGSRIPNLKELRPKRNDIRILFVFDPRRTAILLIGGSKTDDWHGWYERNIPEAERIYDAYLVELKKEGLL